MSSSKPRGLRISDLSEDDRPRERLMLHGASALSNSELLAILIGSGTTESSALELAQRLLQRAQNDLGVLGRFSLIYLNRANRVIRMQLHSRGGSSGTVVDRKAITREALECHAEAVALCHNHPSGTSRPSAQDVAITGQLETALGYFGITLLDHIVIGGHEYSSIRSESATNRGGDKG